MVGALYVEAQWEGDEQEQEWALRAPLWDSTGGMGAWGCAYIGLHRVQAGGEVHL